MLALCLMLSLGLHSVAEHGDRSADVRATAKPQRKGASKVPFMDTIRELQQGGLIRSQFVQVAPARKKRRIRVMGWSTRGSLSFQQQEELAAGEKLVRSKNQTRAVVLIHGFRLCIFPRDVSRPQVRGWQSPRSPLVQALASKADVFAFGYGQNADLATVVSQSGLVTSIQKLEKLGYHEIVLIGHSAGGLIARRLVEDYRNLGVTKVIQLCTPNGGTPTARIKVHKVQQAFLDCLSIRGRDCARKNRTNVTIPRSVQFVSVIALGSNGRTDGVVPCYRQWTSDMRVQGIPAVPLKASHHTATRSKRSVQLLVKLVEEAQPRWTPQRVQSAVEEILGKK